MIRRLILGFALLLFSIPVFPLPPEVRQAIKRANLPESSVSIWAQDVSAKEPLLSHNAKVARNPASVMKLVT
ncbi:MAG: D-alanyl-D-alanine carboxypeptidase/D-alanyl-D-alanine endopeptidase, partial [Burkholderiales bacterium]